VISLRIFVPGTPRPKGSLRHVGKGRMVEQVASSGDWRAAVAYAARQELSEQERLGIPPGAYLDAVRVTIRLQFTPPKSWKGGLPTSRATGDVDKHARNILDALVDAAVIKDDSQVSSLRVAKRYCLADQGPGAHIEVTGAVE
jgi:crossover junction endodeoxyribonuclease RusA